MCSICNCNKGHEWEENLHCIYRIGEEEILEREEVNQKMKHY
jgi:hypothetical protein